MLVDAFSAIHKMSWLNEIVLGQGIKTALPGSIRVMTGAVLEAGGVHGPGSFGLVGSVPNKSSV